MLFIMLLGCGKDGDYLCNGFISIGVLVGVV